MKPDRMPPEKKGKVSPPEKKRTLLDLSQVELGCAGWTVPREHGERFPSEGSHLQRYAGCFSAVEINSSFYRPHRPRTYERWAYETPEGFRFSVKFPKQITHEHRLQNAREPTAAFLDQSAHLGEKLGCYLIQLPPSLRFDQGNVVEFLGCFRELSNVSAVCEPRHASWLTQAARDVLSSFQIGFVQADPSPVQQIQDFDDGGVVYLRLHGSPRMYYSSYDDQQLQKISERIQGFRAQGRDVWCIFDNTAVGAATVNALQLQSILNLASVSTWSS